MEDPLRALIDPDEVLQPYLAAAKDVSNVSTLRSLILKVLSDPNVFAGYNQMHSLVKSHLQGSPDGEKLTNTMDLFSYGSFSDYANSPDRFLSLNESQIFKLKQLTTLSLIEQACRSKQHSLSYDVIQHHLDLENSNQVEQVLVSCIYSRVLVGKLNQKTKTLQLGGTQGPPLCPRDVPMSQVSDLLASIQAIRSTIAGCQEDLNKQQVKIHKEHNTQTKFFKLVNERVKVADSLTRDFGGASAPVLQAQRRGSGWGALGGGVPAAVMAGGDDPMDVGPTAGGRRQKRSRGGLSGVGDMGAFRFSR